MTSKLTLRPAGPDARGEQSGRMVAAAPRQLNLKPLAVTQGLRRLACDAIKRAITEMDIYGQPGEIHLDERRLSEELGVSRTPIREAMTILEQEGFVRSVPRRGVYVVRKTRREIVEMITVWAAIECMAARLAAGSASERELHSLRPMFAKFHGDPMSDITGYTVKNMEFHKAIIRMSKVELMTDLIDNIFLHMRAIREVTLQQGDRARRSIIEHMKIIDAIEARDADLASKLVREHTLGLAAHVEQYCDFLDH